MGETRDILNRVAALRQRLDQVGSLQARTLAELTLRVGEGELHDRALADTVRPLTLAGGEDGPPLPRQLTARARRALEVGRDLLAKLRPLGDFFGDEDELPPVGVDEPLARHYRETVALVDLALRMVPLFPAAASAQLRLCDGLEAVLGEASLRLRRLTGAVHRERAEQHRLDRLAVALTALWQRPSSDPRPFVELADEILAEVAEGYPLRFATPDYTNVARVVAGHSLTVARVVARVARFDGDLHAASREPILAALVQDAGMLGLPVELLAQVEPLTDTQRRQLEAHCHAGATRVSQLWPEHASLANAALAHHERIDGTGYPRGLQGHQQTALARLLAVCDVYVALATPRPHRPALETRTALTETLLLAERGKLDRQCAGALLHLSFYPVGTAVELADGSIGVVVATATPGRDLRNPARPVVALLLDGEGRPLPGPRHLDLSKCEGPSVVRGLDPRERVAILGRHHVDWL